jgi:predicted 3-demethylubiquinone-9 3-methyltransferase (glyoxalase superfamily)
MMIQKVTPFLWYQEKAEEAARFYVSVFKNSKIIETNSMMATFELEGAQFIAFNGGPAQKLDHNISLFIRCETQDEVDYFWNKLKADGGREVQCGWLVDRFGLSWQVVPNILGDLLGDDDREKADRAMQAMLGMVKLDIAALKKAHAG